MEQQREIKFRMWYGKQMKNVDVLAISECTWDCPDFGKFGVSLPYQPSIKVMQYTGLKDKNGKEIYEGDIIRSGRNPNIIHSVEYLEMDARFVAVFKESFCSITQKWCSEFNKEVIGNIFENPELL